MKNNEITKRPNMDIFDKQFPVRLVDAPICDPTKFTILTGDDGILDDLFSYQVYNHLKNHWRAAAAPADIQDGMIWSETVTHKLYHEAGGGDEEILQLTRSNDVSPQFATVRLMDTGADHYLDLKCNEDLGAHRLLNLILGDAARTITLGGDLTIAGNFVTQNNNVTINASGANRTITLSGSPTLGDWFDQPVKQASVVTFGGAIINGKFTLGTPTQLTIAGGAITVTRSYHRVDTQADDATDNLDDINGFTDGMILVLQAQHEDRTVVVRHNQGNIMLAGAANFSMVTELFQLYLFYNSLFSVWVEIARYSG